MSRAPKYWAVVPAAGIGRRMGGSHPKQYQSMCGKSILEHTLDKLLSVCAIEKVVVALSPGDAYWPALACRHHPKIVSVAGGDERADSVLNALQYLLAEAAEDDWVLVHDAARPCVRVHDIETLIQRAGAAGAILATPLSDTVKQVSDQAITATLDRSQLWAAQTPQMFPLRALHDALQSALDKQLQVTDEASAMELAGWRPAVVPAGRDNIKVTHPQDLVLAELILTQQLEG
ncbi:2-C-methyl-D-erythritol 4-phosphate cytidylyltransferase [Gilvimarinus sp. SDUM040013]|uniref:2-C-methyl-D-erythritol 4-phosphate cytidylyltransferase n=1 Tax=Gilvimarinus gilvus TaxID=3058038 RepID=A0ABU4S0N7_9GAMM|nr:2-C-methyl-D-erythritol 4-phosphate cytidylyltransferase [Gilvimarinus sp. SDUM040013]MDO3384481.1 2-C-methyl-D-erythritol 4-phosphate cytidylyltransferase [Gilvimarinus sp. SDUM040013]MDX6850722.1 2-C-methyl-D-erythritol 4-phosphate cytidylyltransferase [Gilvimarinus sp. SDUM040013]